MAADYEHDVARVMESWARGEHIHFMSLRRGYARRVFKEATRRMNEDSTKNFSPQVAERTDPPCQDAVCRHGHFYGAATCVDSCLWDRVFPEPLGGPAAEARRA